MVGLWVLLASVGAGACTVTLGRTPTGVVVGNNEDWIRHRAKLWIEPADDRRPHAAAFFGFEGGGRFAQGGMNDAGLFFDGLGIPPVALLAETRQGRRAAPVDLFRRMLHHATTVDEGLEVLEPWFIPYIRGAQIVVADRHGDWVVLDVNGPIARGHLAIGDSRVFSNARADGDWALTQAISGVPEACAALEADPGVVGARAALVATHQDGERVQSVYSTVFELETARMTTWYLHDYDAPWVVEVGSQPAGTVRFREQFGVP